MRRLESAPRARHSSVGMLQEMVRVRETSVCCVHGPPKELDTPEDCIRVQLPVGLGLARGRHQLASPAGAPKPPADLCVARTHVLFCIWPPLCSALDLRVAHAQACSVPLLPLSVALCLSNSALCRVSGCSMPCPVCVKCYGTHITPHRIC